MPEPNCTVVVPSHNRAGRVHVAKMLPPDSFIVVVNRSQVEAYEREQPELQVVGFDGTEEEKFEWIQKEFPSQIFVDDDYDRMLHHEHAVGEPNCKGEKKSYCKLDPLDALAVMHRTAWECAQAGTFMFGWSKYDIRSFTDWRPFRMLAMLGGAVGQLAGCKATTIHPEIATQGDFWISLLHVYHHRYMWVDDRYAPYMHPSAKFAATPGGAAGDRTLDSEKHDYEVLHRYFGEVVGPRVTTHRAKKLKHDYLPSLYWPMPGS